MILPIGCAAPRAPWGWSAQPRAPARPHPHSAPRPDWVVEGRDRCRCLHGGELSRLIWPGPVPVDGVGAPGFDAAEPGGSGRRARRVLMCAVAKGTVASLPVVTSVRELIVVSSASLTFQ